MMYFIVTIKLKKNPAHNPHDKVTGICPAKFGQDAQCTDVTGEHHSFRVVGESTTTSEHIKQHFMEQGYHVTRVERVPDVVYLLDV